MIRKVLVYASLVVLILNGVRELMYRGIRMNKAGVFEKYNTMFLKENDHNVLFLGSSRAETHFDTKLFDSITELNSYNLGVTGATPRIAYQVLKAYCVKSKLPQYLVMDIDLHFLKYGVDTIRNFPKYFPYLDNEVLLNGFNRIDPRFMSFKFNPFYSLPFSNLRLLSASLHGWLNIPGMYDSLYYKGFAKAVFMKELQVQKVKKINVWINPLERSYLDSIIQFSKQNNIQLLLLTSPMFDAARAEMLNRPKLIKQINNIVRINNLNYYDLSNVNFSADRSCFMDHYHMTAKGAEAFTRQFALHFSQYFDKKGVR